MRGIDLAQGTDNWQAFVNTEWTFGVKSRGIPLVAQEILASQEWLCSMKLFSSFLLH